MYLNHKSENVSAVSSGPRLLPLRGSRPHPQAALSAVSASIINTHIYIYRERERDSGTR